MSETKSELTQLVTQKEVTVGGVLSSAATRERFESNPVSAAVGGGAASGTAGVANALSFGQNMFEYAALGGQTITAPSITANGLNVAMDQTANDGMQMGHGRTSRSKHAYTVGTDGPVYFFVEFTIGDVSGTDDCLVSWTKTQAYQANVDDYTDMAALNVIAGAINIETILNNAATVTTDTTQTWANGETHTLEVRVSETGAVTYLIDGLPPTVTAAFTFDAGDVIVPNFFFLNDTDLVDTLELKDWGCGTMASR